MNNGIQLRLKYICGKYWHLLVPALVLLSAVAFATAGAGLTGEPEPQPVDVTADSMTIDTTLSTEATVTGNTSLYTQGETLTDMPVYLRPATPEVQLIAVTTTPADRSVSITQQIVLDLSATRNGEVFWQDSQTLAIDKQEVTNGTAQTEVTLDIEELASQQLADVTDEAGDIGTIEAQVSATTLYSTDRYSGRTTAQTPLSITDRAYELETPQQDAQTNATTIQQMPPGSTTEGGLAGMLTRASMNDLGTALGGLVALGLAVGVGLTRRRIGDFDAFYRNYVRVRYAEWISQGTIPDADTYDRVATNGLIDLVDIAIDSGKRIVHDPDTARYAVVDGTILYEYNEALDRIQRYVDLSAEDSPQLGSQQRSGFFEPSDSEADTASPWETIEDLSESQPDMDGAQSSSDASMHADGAVSGNDATAHLLSQMPSIDDPIDDSNWEMLREAIDLPDDRRKLGSPSETDTDKPNRQNESQADDSGSDNATMTTNSLWGGLDGATESLD